MKQQAVDMLKVGAGALNLQLSEDKLKQLDLYAEELKKWNRKINLTAITSDGDIAIKHLLDSLVLAKFIRGDATILDVGSGAGVPCIPLKTILPELKVTSIDAVEKKIFFQRNVARLLGFSHFEAVHGRAEQLKPQEGGLFDVVVSRAFSDIVSFARIAGAVVKGTGTVVAMKGKDGREEAKRSEVLLSETGLVICAVEEFVLPVSGDARSLIFLRKNT